MSDRLHVWVWITAGSGKGNTGPIVDRSAWWLLAEVRAEADLEQGIPDPKFTVAIIGRNRTVKVTTGERPMEPPVGWRRPEDWLPREEICK